MTRQSTCYSRHTRNTINFRNLTHPILVQMNLLRGHGISPAAGNFSIHTTYLVISQLQKLLKSYTKNCHKLQVCTAVTHKLEESYEYLLFYLLISVYLFHSFNPQTTWVPSNLITPSFPNTFKIFCEYLFQTFY